MRALYKLRLRLISLLWPHRASRELVSELSFHIERQTTANVAAGMSRDDARAAALREFGGVEQVREECSDMRKVNWLQDLAQDLRYGVRTLAKSPGFATIAIATLAVGIGANTAIFSVVYAVLLRPLPFTEPDQLVFLSEAKPQQGISAAGVSYDNFDEIRSQNHVFSGLGVVQTHELTLTGRGEPTVVDVADVTPELLPLLDTKPVIGRSFVLEDGRQGSEPVVILSENYWHDGFAADPAVVGSSISLDQRSFTIVGVLPADPSILFSPRRIKVWIPVAQDPLWSSWIPRRDLRWLGIVGRLNSGVSIPQAQAEMDAIAVRLAKKFPEENAGWMIRIEPLDRVVVGDVKTALFALLGAVGLILLIACANISNLLLARATSRGKEISLRLALGAGRPRIIRQLLTESAVLGLLGGIAGILIAYFGVRGLVSFLPENIPQVHAVRVDAAVLLFALFLSVAASFVFGLAPAFFAAGSNPQIALNESASRSGEPASRRFARSVLAVAEVALAMVLLIAAGLLLRSFASLTSLNPGFNIEHVVKADIQLPRFQYSKPDQWSAFADDLMRRLQSQPGMTDSAIGIPLPLNSQGAASSSFDIVGHPPMLKGVPQAADYVSISPAYFHVMNIPLLRGRIFNNHDVASAPAVVIISETFAGRYFPNQNPLGKQLMFAFPPKPGFPHEIVGIVGDVRNDSLAREPGPMMYVPFDQEPLWGAEVVVRSGLGVGGVAATIRHEVNQVDKDLPVTDIEAMAGMLDSSVAEPRFRTWLIGLFGVIALVLAAAGIFGVISYSVSRRTHEIGIRITLGASPQSVLRLVLGESARLVLIGLMIGAVAALALGRFLSNLLYGVHATDPVTFLTVAALLAAVALAAAYVPTRRAMRVDPIAALRHE